MADVVIVGSKAIQVITPRRPHRPEIDAERWGALEAAATRQGVSTTHLVNLAIDRLLGRGRGPKQATITKSEFIVVGRNVVHSLALYEGFFAEFEEKLSTFRPADLVAAIALEDLTAKLESATLQCADLRRDLSQATALAISAQRSPTSEIEQGGGTP